MKINTALRDVRTSDEVQHSGFGIEDTSLVFSLMMDKIYSNKPNAVVREICCNALDSGGTFLVSTPTGLDPTFSVRDYGTGMSHEFMTTRYTLLGASTKRDDNAAIGGFGIGRLAPLAYTDMYQVHTYIDGVKRIYTVFKGTDKLPQISLAGSYDTDEPNGTEVRVPIKREDYGTFKSSAASILKWFPEGSFTPYGFTIEPPNWLFKTLTYGVLKGVPTGQSWDTLSRSYKSHKSSVIMGNVRYELDWPGDALPQCVVPFFDIGTLDLPPSRETLSYDKTTIALLNQTNRQIREDLSETTKAMFQDETPWGRMQLWQDLKVGGLTPFTDVEKGEISLDMCVHIYSTSHRSGNLRREPDIAPSYKYFISNTYVIILNDLDESPQALKVYMRLLHSKIRNIIYIPNSDQSVTLSDLKSKFEGHPNEDLIRPLSSFPIPPRESKAKSSFYQMQVRSATHDTYHLDYRFPEHGDVWWPLDGATPAEGWYALRALGIAKGVKVWGLSKTAQKAYDISKFIKFDEYIAAKIKEMADDEGLKAQVKSRRAYNYLKSEYPKEMKTLAYHPDFGCSLYPALSIVKDAISNSRSTTNVENYIELIEKGHLDDLDDIVLTKVVKALNTVFKKPIMRLALDHPIIISHANFKELV